MAGNKFINTLLRENTIFLLVSFLVFSSEPAILYAQSDNPYAFTEPLTVSRGSLMPSSPNAEKVPHDEMCNIVTTEWGWADCDNVDTMVFFFTPEIDTLMIDKPDTSGYVELDDWETDEREEVISSIEEHLHASLEDQSKRAGMAVTFEGWRVYPTLNADKKYMYYAQDIGWDGEIAINVTAVVFDRRGYVTFSIIPADSDMNETEMVASINHVLDKYHPNAEEDYASFVTGDQVAAVGAVGVLASLVGVKYSKGAIAGIIAALTLLVKKAWFILLVPVLWIFGWAKRLFGRSD